jgi:hypothetical protein
LTFGIGTPFRGMAKWHSGGKTMPALRRVVAVIVAGVVGTLANAIVVAALTPNRFIPLALSPGRNAVAIAVALLLPAIYAMTSGTAAAISALSALTVIPSLLAKLVFGAAAPWPFVLGVNAVYALAAWAVYCAIARIGASRPRRRSA